MLDINLSKSFKILVNFSKDIANSSLISLKNEEIFPKLI